MTTRRDEALARLAQQLQVPAHLLNLYPPAANHWTAVADAQRQSLTHTLMMATLGRRWGKTLMWEALYGGPPLPTRPDEFGERCYPGAYVAQPSCPECLPGCPLCTSCECCCDCSDCYEYMANRLDEPAPVTLTVSPEYL